MLEVEMKFPVTDFARLEALLQQRGAEAAPPIDEADHYFNAPDRDFKTTDEALRVRRIGAANFVTYKGPKLDTQTKTRTEIEVPLAEGDRAAEDFMRLLTKLGYRPVTVVRKRRRIYRFSAGSFAVEACLDEAAEVGNFAELEIVVPPEQLDAARTVLLNLAGELGLGQPERRSYLQMLLEKRNQ